MTGNEWPTSGTLALGPTGTPTLKRLAGNALPRRGNGDPVANHCGGLGIADEKLAHQNAAKGVSQNVDASVAPSAYPKVTRKDKGGGGGVGMTGW